MFADSHSPLAGLRNHYSKPFSDVRNTEIHTTQSVVPETLDFGIEMAVDKLKRYKSPGINRIPAEWINRLALEMDI